jgi:hypothetical protein
MPDQKLEEHPKNRIQINVHEPSLEHLIVRSVLSHQETLSK